MESSPIDAISIIIVVLVAAGTAFAVSLATIGLMERQRARVRPLARPVERRRPREYQRWHEPIAPRSSKPFDFE